MGPQSSMGNCGVIPRPDFIKQDMTVLRAAAGAVSFSCSTNERLLPRIMQIWKKGCCRLLCRARQGWTLACVVLLQACFVLPLCLHMTANSLPPYLQMVSRGWPWAKCITASVFCAGRATKAARAACERLKAPNRSTSIELQRHLSALLARLLGSPPLLGPLPSPGLRRLLPQQLRGRQLSSSSLLFDSRTPDLAALTMGSCFRLLLCSGSTADAAGPPSTRWLPSLHPGCPGCLHTGWTLVRCPSAANSCPAACRGLPEHGTHRLQSADDQAA